MDLVFYAIGAGIILFLGLMWALKILFKLFEVNPLLHLGGIYVVFHLFVDKLTASMPESWQVKQFENFIQIKGSIGFVLRLSQPKMSAYDITVATFGICIIGYFIYAFTLKEYFAKRKVQKETQQ